MDCNWKEKMKLKDNHLLIIAITLLFLITILTQFYGNADIGDYANVAKFFSGDYKAQIRSSHSYFYGFLSSPFVKITGNFFAMKIMNLIWLILIILSIYYISDKNRKTLLLTITAPIFWYMAPIINPIQISSLFFLWGFYFLRKYDDKGKFIFLSYSGIFFGLAWVFWDTVLHLGIILTLVFFYNKKFSHLIYFIFFVFIGLIPRLILDQILFNFAFFTILKSFTGGFVNLLFSGSIGSGHSAKTFMNIFSMLIFLPLFSFILIKKQNFSKNKKTTIFLILSILLFLTNPQPRYLLIIIPLILLDLGKIISQKQFKIQIIFSIILSLLVITPYVIQINYYTNSQEFTSLITNINKVEISKINPNELIIEDLNQMGRDYPSQIFLVGPNSDDYAFLARLYFGDKINEFVSIQDYNLFLQNKTTLFEKKFQPVPKINERRLIWIAGGIDANLREPPLYENINYAISINESLNLQGFNLEKKYNFLYLYRKLD